MNWRVAPYLDKICRPDSRVDDHTSEHSNYQQGQRANKSIHKFTNPLQFLKTICVPWSVYLKMHSCRLAHHTLLQAGSKVMYLQLSSQWVTVLVTILILGEYQESKQQPRSASLHVVHTLRPRYTGKLNRTTHNKNFSGRCYFVDK